MKDFRLTHLLVTCCLLALLGWSCRQSGEAAGEQTVYQDTPFWQEYHEAYPIGRQPEENQVRSVAVDEQNTVWAATAAGVFWKKAGERTWEAGFAAGGSGTRFCRCRRSAANGLDGNLERSLPLPKQ